VRSGLASTHVQAVMDNLLVKRLLLALASALPDDGPDQLTGITIRQGWGGMINVQAHSSLPLQRDKAAIKSLLEEVVRSAVGERRHGVSVEFESH
jgi:hypothetical protein